MNYLRLLLLMATLFLAACTSMHNYRYQSPHNIYAKRCIGRCLVGKASCEQLCLIKNPRCERQAQQAAVEPYENYKQRMLALGKPIKKQLRDFVDDESCKKACHCTQAFNTCYAACGGTVQDLGVL